MVIARPFLSNCFCFRAFEMNQNNERNKKSVTFSVQKKSDNEANSFDVKIKMQLVLEFFYYRSEWNILNHILFIFY